MLISALASSIKPYTAGEQPQGGGWVKLNTNENPYPCAAYGDFDRTRLRLYPDPDCMALKAEIAALHGVSPDMVFVGNGSDEVLAIAFLALFEPHAAPVLAPDITYSFYPVYASLFGIEYRTVPTDAEFRIVAEDYAVARDVGGIVFANPNAPTSLAMPREAALGIVRAHPEIAVIVDEAYIDFGGESVIDAVGACENLLVVRTFSKSWSLAGLRVGYAVGSRTLVGALERIKNCFNSYTVDAFAQHVAVSALRARDVMRDNVAGIVATRTETVRRLRSLGWAVVEPSANFVFAKPAGRTGKEVFDALKRRKILVRRWDAPRIEDYLRISIGTDGEMARLFDALTEITKEAT